MPDSRATEIIEALNLPIPVLDALIAASHTNPRLLNKRLETLGVAMKQAPELFRLRLLLLSYLGKIAFQEII